MDTFDIDYKSAQDLCGRLQAQVGDARAGQGGASQKYLMKSNYNKVQEAMSNFDKLIYSYENNPSTFSNLSKKELQKRIDKIRQLKREADEINADYTMVASNNAVQTQSQDNDLERAAYQRGADGEYDATRELDNRQIIGVQKDMLAQQDKQLDDVIGVVKATKYEGEDMKKELLLQNKQLELLGENIERTDENMIKVDNQMKGLLKASKQWVLWAIIVVELIVMILILSL